MAKKIKSLLQKNFDPQAVALTLTDAKFIKKNLIIFGIAFLVAFLQGVLSR